MITSFTQKERILSLKGTLFFEYLEFRYTKRVSAGNNFGVLLIR